MRTKLLTAAAVVSLTASAAQAQDKIKIGVLATLEGALTTLGEDALRGMEVAMKQAGAKAGGKTIEIITFPTNASPDSAIRGARKLVEQDKVDILIGPVSGSEGIAIRDYSKTQPQMTFVNGSSGALETTYVTPSANFFRFNMDGAQWLVGPRRLRLQRQEVAQDRDRGGRLFVPLHAALRLRAGILPARRADHRELLGAARHQGLRLDHRQAARRRRRDLSRPRRRRRGQLLQPVRPGRRQGEADRRLDHGRPDRALVEGRRQAHRDRHPDRRPAGRRVGQCEVEGLGEALSGRVPGRQALHLAVADRHRLLQRLQRGVHGAQQDQRRPLATATRSSARSWPSSSSTRRTARSSSTRTARRSAPTSSPKWSRCRTAISSTRS